MLSTTSYEQLFAALKVETVEMKRLGLSLPSIPEDTHTTISVTLTKSMRENEEMLPAVEAALNKLLGEWRAVAAAGHTPHPC